MEMISINVHWWFSFAEEKSTNSRRVCEQGSHRPVSHQQSHCTRADRHSNRDLAMSRSNISSSFSLDAVNDLRNSAPGAKWLNTKLSSRRTANRCEAGIEGETNRGLNIFTQRRGPRRVARGSLEVNDLRGAERARWAVIFKSCGMTADEERNTIYFSFNHLKKNERLSINSLMYLNESSAGVYNTDKYYNHI